MRSFVGRGGMWVAGQVAFFAVFVAALTASEDIGPVVRLAGATLVVVGAVLVVGGLGALGRRITPYPEPVRNGALVRSGIYGTVRHPIYGGLAIGAIGLGMLVGSWRAVAVACALLLYFRLKASAEEHRLLAVYPDYARYRREVRAMLLPFLF